MKLSNLSLVFLVGILICGLSFSVKSRAETNLFCIERNAYLLTTVTLALATGLSLGYAGGFLNKYKTRRSCASDEKATLFDSRRGPRFNITLSDTPIVAPQGTVVRCNGRQSSSLGFGDNDYTSGIQAAYYLGAISGITLGTAWIYSLKKHSGSKARLLSAQSIAALLVGTNMGLNILNENRPLDRLPPEQLCSGNKWPVYCNKAGNCSESIRSSSAYPNEDFEIMCAEGDDPEGRILSSPKAVEPLQETILVLQGLTAASVLGIAASLPTEGEKNTCPENNMPESTKTASGLLISEV